MNIQEDLGLFGNTLCFESLYRWLRDAASTGQACLLMTGPTGTGKTYGVEQMCSQLGMVIRRIDSTNCHSIRELEDMLNKAVHTTVEEALLQQGAKRVLLIDELEVLLQTDRNMPSVLFQAVQEMEKNGGTHPPILVCCNSSAERRIGSIRRAWRCIDLRPPSEAEVLLMLRSHTKKRGIRVGAETLLTISEGAGGNMHHALNMLQLGMSNAVIDQAPPIEALYDNPSIQTAKRLFQEDMWMTPMRFHENLPCELHYRTGGRAKKSKAYSDILRCMMEWDVMMGSAHADENMEDIFLEHLCRAPCHLLSSLPRRKTNKTANMDAFSKTLSQMSLQKKMDKKTYEDDFPWKHLGNYIFTLKKR
jgi:DNA polymerase III delta prime subunit